MAGFPIATGVIEGACRHLVKDRLDITGARWSVAGAEAILRLRSLRASGDFDEYFQFHQRQRLVGEKCGGPQEGGRGPDGIARPVSTLPPSPTSNPTGDRDRCGRACSAWTGRKSRRSTRCECHGRRAVLHSCFPMGPAADAPSPRRSE